MATGHGSVALGVFALSSGNGSVAMGNSVQASADQATAFGNGTVASGVGSVAMGVGGQATAGSAFAAGWYTTASGHNSTALGNWASTNGQTGAFVLGDFSVASNVSASARDQFTARFQNGYRLFTNSALTAGVALAPGGGAWQTVSDARKKTAFRAVDGEEVLAKLAALPVTTWQYKAQDASVRHMGPTAQEFRAAFGLGESDTTITTTDADGVALAAARALEARTRALAARLDALARENAALRRQVAALGGPGARGRGAARQVGTR
jgi:hypothetical protein